jgi:hypothetical protein
MHPVREVSIGNFRIGGNHPLALIAGAVRDLEQSACSDDGLALLVVPAKFDRQINDNDNIE